MYATVPATGPTRPGRLPSHSRAASGRTPTVTVEGRPAAPGIASSSPSAASRPPLHDASKKLIAGEPMKPATNRFAGRS
jgi:hypothetical protein